VPGSFITVSIFYGTVDGMGKATIPSEAEVVRQALRRMVRRRRPPRPRVPLFTGGQRELAERFDKNLMPRSGAI
jgi:hypothetical protein